MDDGCTYTVKLLCKLAIFYSYTGLYSCDIFETNRCPVSLPKDKYLRVHGDKCYRFFTSEVSWTSARDLCIRTGGQLISITRRDIQLFVERTLSEIWSKNGMWIGANDRDSEMDWFWVTGKRISSGFQNWGFGQPSCLPFMCAEDCACLRVDDNYRWHDYRCWRNHGFACEYYLLPVPKPRIPETTTTTTTTTTRKTTTSTTTTTTTTTPASTVLQTQSPISTETTEKKLQTAYTKMTTVVNADTTSGPSARTNLSGLPESTSDTATTRLPVTGIVVGALIGVIVIVIMAVLLTITIQRKQQTSSVEKRLTTQQRSKDGNEFAHRANTQASGLEMTESDYDTIGSNCYCYVDIDHRAGSVHAYNEVEADTKQKKMLQMKETRNNEIIPSTLDHYQTVRF